MPSLPLISKSRPFLKRVSALVGPGQKIIIVAELELGRERREIDRAAIEELVGVAYLAGDQGRPTAQDHLAVGSGDGVAVDLDRAFEADVGVGAHVSVVALDAGAEALGGDHRVTGDDQVLAGEDGLGAELREELESWGVSPCVGTSMGRPISPATKKRSGKSRW